MKLQKLGGYSQITAICLFIVYTVIWVPLLSRYGLNEPDALLDTAKMSALYSGSSQALQMLGAMQILSSILTLIVALGLRERMQAKAPNLVLLLLIASSAYCVLNITRIIIDRQSMAAMASVADVSIYKSFLLIHNGFSTAKNYINYCVVLLIGVAAITTHSFPRFIGYAALIVGISWIVGDTLPKPTGTAGIVVSIILLLIVLLYVVTMIWMGVEMLRAREADPAKL